MALFLNFSCEYQIQYKYNYFNSSSHFYFGIKINAKGLKVTLHSVNASNAQWTKTLQLMFSGNAHQF